MRIEISGITKKYQNKNALKIEKLVVENREFATFLGNNGAGKTTLFRLILDLIKADSGMIQIGDSPVAKTEKWKAYTGAFLDRSFLIDFLTPEEYLLFSGALYGLNKKAVFKKLEEFEDFFNGQVLKTHKYIRDLSAGNQQKVGIAAALLHEPEFIILDEPFSIIDPSSKIKLSGILKQAHTKTGATMIISSNILEPVLNLSTRIVLLEQGQIFMDNPAGAASIDKLQEYFFNR